MVKKILLFLAIIPGFLLWSQVPPCGNDYGSSTDEANIIQQMRYGSIADVINAISLAKNTRGTSLGCPQEAVVYQTADFTEPTLSEIETIWNTVHKTAIEAIVVDCPRIGRYESNAALGAYYAELAGYPINETVLANIGDMMTDQQYSSANVTTVVPEHEGVFGYIHVGNLNPCYPGGVVGSSVESVCSNAPSLCIAYEFGQFSGEEFLVGDQYAPLDFYDGGLAYDHGWIGIHMIEAAIQQDDSVLRSKFKNAAVLAGKWAISEYAVKNHNYTAKLIWLLAELYAWSGQDIYKNALNEKLDRNLIPGILWDADNDGFVDGTSPGVAFSSLYSNAQTEGRMWDGHNSLPWYQAMNTWAMVEAYVAFRDQGETTRAAELKPYAVSMLDNLANEISTQGTIDPSYLGVRDVAYALLIGIWKIAQYESESHLNWEQAAWALWNSGAFNTYSTNSVCVGLYLIVQSGTAYQPLPQRMDFNSIPDLTIVGGLRIYPNPVTENINLIFANELHANVTVQIFDSSGRKMIDLVTAESELNLDLSNLESGSYIVKLVLSEEEMIEKKFVKL